MSNRPKPKTTSKTSTISLPSGSSPTNHGTKPLPPIEKPATCQTTQAQNATGSRFLQIAPSVSVRFREHVREWATHPSSGFLPKPRDARSTTPNVSNHLYRREYYQSAGCRLCNLCRNRKHVVLYRGYCPCDVLFIGEAPGESEDALGVPFIGSSGQLLERLWQDAYSAAIPQPCPNGPPKLGITNIVACIPRSPAEHATGELRPPNKEEAAACQPRLLEILELANPQIIVLLGDTAKRFFPKMHNHPFRNKLQRWNGKLLCLAHPAAILRQDNLNHAELMSKRFVLTLSSELKELT